MLAVRRSLVAALALAAGSALAAGVATSAGATTPPPVPQYLIRFEALGAPGPVPGLTFHSTACVIGPATNPILVNCKESGHVVFSSVGGEGVASLSSVIAGIKWTFILIKSSAAGSTTYLMNGTGTESQGTTPIQRPVRVTGKITVIPTPAGVVGPLVKGTEAVYLLPVPAA
jgi:hypothetical protein